MPKTEPTDISQDLLLEESSILWLETLGYAIHCQPNDVLERAFAREAAKWELSAAGLQDLVREAFVQPFHRVNTPAWRPLERFEEVSE